MIGRTLTLLAVAVIALITTTAPAQAYWSADAALGGSGAAAATSIEQVGSPTASAAGATVTVSWPPSALSNGEAVSGYLVTRYDAATGAAQIASSACAGVVNGTACVEQDVPSGTWRYAVVAVSGTNWVGPRSDYSEAVTTDATPPMNAFSLAVLSGGAAPSGTTVYYRGTVAGSFQLINALTDTGSGPASSTTSALTGDSGGWSHDPTTVAVPANGPFVSAPFSWVASTGSSPTEVVTGLDRAGNATSTPLGFVNDSTPPTVGTIDYRNGNQPDLSVLISTTTGSDTGSGIGSMQLQRTSAPLSSEGCGGFTDYVDVGPAAATSPWRDTGVNDGTCYIYRYVVTDRVGNRTVATTSQVARIDSTAWGPPLGTVAAFSVFGSTGVVNTGQSVISGDLGTSPSTSVTGFPPGVVSGTLHAGDSAAAAARADLLTAYNTAAARPHTDFSGDLGGRTFFAGVHHTSAALAITGTLTLDGENDPDAIFIFQSDAAANTAAASRIDLVNGAQAANVFWQVAGATGTGAGSDVVGTILSAGAITLGAGTQLIGRALSLGTVTLAGVTVRFTSAAPPSIAFTAGLATATTKDVTPSLTGTSSAASGQPVTLTIDGQTLHTTVGADGSWAVDAAVLTAGTYSVVASVRDPAGNAGNATQMLTVEVNPALVDLGAAAAFCVLASTGVVNTGASLVAGDLGTSPSAAVTGFPPGIVLGTVHPGDPTAEQARAALAGAYADAAARTPHTHFVGDLGGRTFHMGVHHTSAALALTGTVTLDAENDPDAVFIFQTEAAANTAANSVVRLVNGAQASHVFWQVAGATGTGASSTFIGTVLSGGAITVGANAVVIGRVLSFGTITLAANDIRFR